MDIEERLDVGVEGCVGDVDRADELDDRAFRVGRDEGAHGDIEADRVLVGLDHAEVRRVGLGRGGRGKQGRQRQQAACGDRGAVHAGVPPAGPIAGCVKGCSASGTVGCIAGCGAGCGAGFQPAQV
jgi:hypothetical protein